MCMCAFGYAHTHILYIHIIYIHIIYIHIIYIHIVYIHIHSILPPFQWNTPRPSHTHTFSPSCSLSLICMFGTLKFANTATIPVEHAHTHMPQFQLNMHTHSRTLCCFLSHTTHCNTLSNTGTHCNTLQHTATHCNTLQHTAAHCNNTLCRFLTNTCAN